MRCCSGKGQELGFRLCCLGLFYHTSRPNPPPSLPFPPQNTVSPSCHLRPPAALTCLGWHKHTGAGSRSSPREPVWAPQVLRWRKHALWLACNTWRLALDHLKGDCFSHLFVDYIAPELDFKLCDRHLRCKRSYEQSIVNSDISGQSGCFKTRGANLKHQCILLDLIQIFGYLHENNLFLCFQPIKIAQIFLICSTNCTNAMWMQITPISYGFLSILKCKTGKSDLNLENKQIVKAIAGLRSKIAKVFSYWWVVMNFWTPVYRKWAVPGERVDCGVGWSSAENMTCRHGLS